jgi:hypothetical protein
VTQEIDSAGVKRVLSPGELDKFINEYVEGWVKWYWDETRTYYRLASGLRISSLCLSAIISVLAALSLLTELKELSLGIKVAVFLLSSLSTLLSALLVQHGVERTAQLREGGRIEMMSIKQLAILRLANMPMTLDERVTFQAKVINDIKKVEKEFGGRFFKGKGV